MIFMEVSQKELSEALGITTRQIYRLTSEKNMFRARIGGKYDLAACVQEYLNFKVEEAKSGAHGPDYWEEKAKHEHTKLEMSLIKLAKMRRETFDANDVEDAWAFLLLEFKNAMQNMPHRLAPLVVGNDDIFDITRLIEGDVNDMLLSLSQFDIDKIKSDDDLTGDEEDEEERIVVPAKSETPAKAGRKNDNKRVGGNKKKG